MRVEKNLFVRTCAFVTVSMIVWYIYSQQDGVSTPWAYNRSSFVNVVNITAISDNDSASCIHSKTVPSFIICVHDVQNDIYISNSLITSGLWEPKSTELFLDILKDNPNLTVLDVGANIGYYSLMAAAAGSHVVAVEPLERNLKLFAKAIILNRFENKITVFENAVSSRNGHVRLDVSSVTNQGAARVVADSEVLLSDNTVKMAAVTLDDLVNFIPTQNVVIKLDVEAHECKVLQSSKSFFDTFHVLYILTEWSKMTSVRHRHGVACPPETIRQIAIMLERSGFVPYDVSLKARLDIGKADRWRNDDIYWKNLH